MLKKHSLRSYIKYSVAAALLYCITVWIFIYNDAFAMSYILYIGNMLFAVCIAAFIWFYNKKRKENASAGMMVFAGHITTVMGIIIACIISLILVFLVAPNAFDNVKQTTEALEQSPAQLQGKNRGLLLVLFMNAIVGNVSAGSFISILLPYTAKRDQKGDTAEMDSTEIKLQEQAQY